MDTFEKLLDLQKDLLQSQLKTIYRYQQQYSPGKKKIRRTSKPVSYTHLTLPTIILTCRCRGWRGD